MPSNEKIRVVGGPLDGGVAYFVDDSTIMVDCGDYQIGWASSVSKWPDTISQTIQGCPTTYARTPRGYEFTGWR